MNGATSQQHSVVTSETAEAVWFVGCLALIKATTESTGGALAMVELTHPADFATPPHIHHEEDEAFYILEGAMKGFCGVDEWRATAGDFVWLPRGVPHGYATDGARNYARSRSRSRRASSASFVMLASPRSSERCLRPPSWTCRSWWPQPQSMARSSLTPGVRRGQTGQAAGLPQRAGMSLELAELCGHSRPGTNSISSFVKVGLGIDRKRAGSTS